MKEVSRACFNCKYYSSEDIYLKPDNAGVQRAFDKGFDEHTTTDDPCDICGTTPSLKKE